jgi:hypothetical protein
VAWVTTGEVVLPFSDFSLPFSELSAIAAVIEISTASNEMIILFITTPWIDVLRVAVAEIDSVH